MHTSFLIPNDTDVLEKLKKNYFTLYSISHLLYIVFHYFGKIKFSAVQSHVATLIVDLKKINVIYTIGIGVV